MSGGILSQNFKILKSVDAELLTQFLGVIYYNNALESQTCQLYTWQYISAVDSAQAPDVTIQFSGLRQNFDVVWLNKDDSVLLNTECGSVDAFVPPSKAFVRLLRGQCL